MSEFKIDIDTTGFVRDAKYRQPIWELCNKYKNSFPSAENLLVTVREMSYVELGNNFQGKEKSVLISPDKKSITVSVKVHKYYDTKGKVTSIPDPVDIIRDIRFLLKKAVEEFNQQ